MRIAIYIYIIFYLLFSISILLDDFKDKAPLWEKISDVVLLPLGLAGMVFYLTDPATSSLKTIWKGVSALLIVGNIITGLYVTRRHREGKTNVDPADISEAKWVVIELTVILTLLPMLMLNILFAFD